MTEPTVDPSHVYALVVGIEQYLAGPEYNLNGPARDALNFAQWLLAHGVQPANIQLFLSLLEQNRGVLTEAEQQGLTPQVATRELISRTITERFVDKGGREKVLYVFWAGHGFITKLKTTTRRLLFADTDTHNKWNLEFDALLQAFQTAQHGKVFPRQIFLVDACANSMFRDFYPTLQAEAAGEGFVTSGTQGQAEQFALFAAAEYAVATNLAQAGTGRFSQAVLAELQAQSLWPEMPELARKIQAKFRDQQHLEPVFWSFSLGGGNREEIDTISQRMAMPAPLTPMSTSERLQLIKTLNALTPVEFEVLITTLNPPSGLVPPSGAAQGLRSSAFLQWIEGPTGPGLNELQAVLGQVMVGASPVRSPNDPDREVKLEKPEKKLERDVVFKKGKLEHLGHAHYDSDKKSDKMARPPIISEVNSYSKLLDLGSGVKLEVVYVHGSGFLIGVPKGKSTNQHHVIVPDFWMGKFPVTQDQYRAVMGKNPSEFKGYNLPVECVSWHDALAFCERMSKQISGWVVRLPSESEWEYACRADTTTAYHFGDRLSENQANFDCLKNQTTPAGIYPANSYGLYDMHGNVREWCLDIWHETYLGAPTDGRAWVTDGDIYERVLRGGSWLDGPWYCRSDYRKSYPSTNRRNSVGFRVACIPSSTTR